MACATTNNSQFDVDERVPFTVFEPYILHGKGPWNQSDDLRYSQKEWSRVLGVSRRSVGRWVKVGVPSRYIEPICRRLGLEPVELLGRGHPIFQTGVPEQLKFMRLEDDPILGDFAKEVHASVPA